MMEWIVTSSVLILIVSGLRSVLKGKISLRLQYALWLLVLVRLLCPVNLISSPTSILNVTKEAAAQPEVINVIESVRNPLTIETQDILTDPVTGESNPVTNVTVLVPKENPNHWYSAEELLMGLWIMGAVATGGFMLTCNLSFRRKLRKDRKTMEVTETCLPVYVCPGLETPCMCGLFRPTIYLTPESTLNQDALHHVLEHELTHYYHCDYIIAPLRCLALAIHWYNPLVWWAAKTSRLDGELACDEGTIARLGESERSSYGATLIRMTCAHNRLSDVMLTATTMCGSKRSIKERISCIARKPRMAAMTVAVVALTALIAVGCTFTGATNTMSNSLQQEIREHGEEYLQEINFSLQQQGGEEPYGLLFLPEYMPREGLTLEVKAIHEDGTEEVLYTQDTVELGKKYIFENLEQYGRLSLSAYYLVEDQSVGLRHGYIDLNAYNQHRAEAEMAESVQHLMKEFAADYFVKNMDRHNNLLFLEDEEKYSGVIYQDPVRVVTPMATEQNLYLHKYEGRFVREDGERITDTVYVLMHWGTEYWQRVCGVDQKTIDSYNTPEMLEKYGNQFDAAAIELYLKHKDDAVNIDGTTRVSIVFDQETEEMLSLRHQTEDFILYTIQQDYPAQSLNVRVKDLRVMELNPEVSGYYLCYLAFYPEMLDGGRGMDYQLYQVVTKDEMGIPFFLKAYEAKSFAGDEDAKDQIGQAVLEWTQGE